MSDYNKSFKPVGSENKGLDYNVLPTTNGYASIELLQDIKPTQRSQSPFGYLKFKDGDTDHVTNVEMGTVKYASRNSEVQPFEIDGEKEVFVGEDLLVNIDDVDGEKRMSWKAKD